ncbi:MAG: hypothetical protein WC533_00650 [Candidatus Pacearchaeota archaeon]
MLIKAYRLNDKSEICVGDLKRGIVLEAKPGAYYKIDVAQNDNRDSVQTGAITRVSKILKDSLDSDFLINSIELNIK